MKHSFYYVQIKTFEIFLHVIYVDFNHWLMIIHIIRDENLSLKTFKIAYLKFEILFLEPRSE